MPEGFEKLAEEWWKGCLSAGDAGKQIGVSRDTFLRRAKEWGARNGYTERNTHQAVALEQTATDTAAVLDEDGGKACSIDAVDSPRANGGTSDGHKDAKLMARRKTMACTAVWRGAPVSLETKRFKPRIERGKGPARVGRKSNRLALRPCLWCSPFMPSTTPAPVRKTHQKADAQPCHAEASAFPNSV